MSASALLVFFGALSPLSAHAGVLAQQLTSSATAASHPGNYLVQTHVHAVTDPDWNIFRIVIRFNPIDDNNLSVDDCKWADISFPTSGAYWNGTQHSINPNGSWFNVTITADDASKTCTYTSTNEVSPIASLSAGTDYDMVLATGSWTGEYLQTYGAPLSTSTSMASSTYGYFSYNGGLGEASVTPDANVGSAFYMLCDDTTCGSAATTTATSTGVSNVLFLPGIEGSRLYMPTDPSCDPHTTDCPETKIWESNGDGIAKNLFLDPNGNSINPNIYTKEGDVVDTYTPAGTGLKKLYVSFKNDLDTLQASTTFDGGKFKWKAIAYDWRLSLPTIAQQGSEINGKIFYEDATNTPYIQQELQSLASSSPTGKVTIIAHSNGGLVAKELMQELGDAKTADLIDKVIFVGVPQSGAPQDVAGLLFGYGTALPLDNCSSLFNINTPCAAYISRVAGRTFASTSPMAYQLLPSSAYFNDLLNHDHPVVSFENSIPFAKQIAAYGSTIDNTTELYSYLQNGDNDRVQPSSTDIGNPSILNNAQLINYGSTIHNVLDSWRPPSGVSLYQIAGWGIDTPAGIKFSKNPVSFIPGVSAISYVPDMVEDGDGVVPIPSSLLVPVSPNSHQLWLDLSTFDRSTHQTHNHVDLLELDPIRTTIQEILNNRTIDTTYISTTQPPPQQIGKQLIFFLHSPLTLGITDQDGNYTGVSTDGSIRQDIPGSQYGEFGEVKYLIVPAGNLYKLSLVGLSSGHFNLDIAEQDGNTLIATSTIAGVPVTASTTASLSITNGINDASPLSVDENGDGKQDYSLKSVANAVTVFDSVPPEAQFSFDSKLVKPTATRLDDISGTSSPLILPAGISSYSVSDEAGNTLKALFSKDIQQSGLSTVVISGLSYNGSSTINITATSTYYELTLAGKPYLFLAHLKAGNSNILAFYNVLLNKTAIMSAVSQDDSADLPKLANSFTFTSRPVLKLINGLVIPFVVTAHGTLNVRY